MSNGVEFRCFIGGLSWSTSDRNLKDAFGKFGNLVEAKVVMDKVSGRSRGFGFVTFDEKQAVDEAIEAMNGIDLDGRTIIVDKAQPNQAPRKDYSNDGPRDSYRAREHGRLQGSGSGECFKCGKTGHFARECPSDGARGGKYGSREDQSGSRGGGRFGTGRSGDRFGGRGRDSSGRGRGDHSGRDRAGPYDRRGPGAFRSS